MKRAPKHARIYITLLTVIAVLLILWSVSNLHLERGIPSDLKLAAGVFLLLALVCELIAVEIAEYGYISPAFAIYFALIVKYDFPIAVIIATIAMAARALFVNRHKKWLRLADFSTHLINICLAGIIFSVINRSAPFLSTLNLIAMVIGAVAYYGLEQIIQNTVVGLLNEEIKEEYETSRDSINLFRFTLAPLGLLIILAYDKSPWFMLLAPVPLVALRNSIKFGIREIKILDQEELVHTIEELETDLEQTSEKNEELSSELNKKVDEQSILMEMGEALGTSVNLEGTLEIVVSMIRKLVIYQSCVIFLIEDKTLVAAKSVTPYRDVLEYSSLLKLQESIVNLVFQSKKPILIPDMQSMSEQRIFKDEKSVICAPLIVKNEIIGVLYVGDKKPGTYNEDHLHLLSMLVNAASNAIRTSQLYDQVQRKSVELQRVNSQLASKVHSFSMLLDIGQKLSSSLNFDETQKIIIDSMEEMFGYQSAAVFRVRNINGKSVLVPTRYRSPYEVFFENLKLTLDDKSNIMGQIATYRKPLLLPDTREAKIQTILEKERSTMVVPMIVENELTGAIYLGHAEPGYFDEESLNLLEAVAHNSAMALQNAELYEETVEKSITDGLTGLYTQRYFQERLSESINEAKREKFSVALIMIDADHFKSLNDTLGHPEGDKCLVTLANIMRKYTRESDLICRVGGDEFVVMLRKIDKKNAYKKAEAIRRAVQQRFHDQPVQITTSIGLAVFPYDARNKKDLIATADAALYKSKKMGRNRVSVASGPVRGKVKKQPLPRD